MFHFTNDSPFHSGRYDVEVTEKPNQLIRWIELNWIGCHLLDFRCGKVISPPRPSTCNSSILIRPIVQKTKILCLGPIFIWTVGKPLSAPI